jgi:hypothetical protein
MKGDLDAQNTRLKGELDAALERGRQAFSRDLERERQAAATTLEQYKSALSQEAHRERQGMERALEEFRTQLTFEAEVRRKVAAKKVDAVLNIAAQTKTLVEEIYGPSTPKDIVTLNKPMVVYWNALRESLLLIGPETAAAVEAFGREVSSAIQEWIVAQQPGPRAAPVDLADRGEAARNRLFDVLRRELRIEPYARAETKP